MVSYNQVKNGIIQYMDDEILPKVSAPKRYGVMVYMALLMDNFDQMMNEISNLPAVSFLNVITCDKVDIDRIHQAAYSSMKQSIDIDIPVVGRFTFSHADIDRLCDMIRRS